MKQVVSEFMGDCEAFSGKWKVGTDTSPGPTTYPYQHTINIIEISENQSQAETFAEILDVDRIRCFELSGKIPGEYYFSWELFLFSSLIFTKSMKSSISFLLSLLSSLFRRMLSLMSWRFDSSTSRRKDRLIPRKSASFLRVFIWGVNLPRSSSERFDWGIPVPR